MKTVVWAMLALAFVAALPPHVEARPKKHAYVRETTAHAADRGTRRPEAERQQEYIADKRPVGTSGWWEQMLREGRAGTCCN